MGDTTASNYGGSVSCGDHHFQGPLAGASNFGINNAKFTSAGNLYENCNISVNSAPVASEIDDQETFQKIANWLTKINFRNINTEALSKRAVGTGLWFTRTKEYHRWQHEDLNIIWGTGMPGAGKTVLSATVVDQLRKELSARRFLAAWIRQILEYDPTTLEHVRKAYLIHRRQETYPSETELQDLFSTICSTFEKVYIVLDGLDEALDDVKITLLETVNSLPSNTRTLIMSRPLKSFEYLVQNVAFVDIEARNEDIELFVQKKIDQSPRLRTLLLGRGNERERLCTAVKRKSRGMFLVASLQMEALKRSISIKALFQTLEILPSGVDDLYKLTLERIEAQGEPEASLAKRAILWLVFALETFTVKMLQDALAVDVDMGVFDEDGIVRKEFLIDICCGLVVQSFPAARLIHYTAQDFFKVVGSGWIPAHTHLSSSCVIYLSSPPRNKDGHDSIPNEGLLKYAERHWGAHARLSRQESGVSRHVSQFIAQASAHSWRLGRYHDSLNSQQLASFHGLTELFHENSSSCDTQVTPRCGFTLLHMAAMGGHVDCAKLVLDRWPEVSFADRSRDWTTPLMLASMFGHDQMVEFLLSVDPEEPESINAIAECGCSALDFAVNGNHKTIIQIFLSKQKFKVDFQNGRLFAWAASNGHISLLRQLLQSNPGIDINVQHPITGLTFLCYACRSGHPQIVELLLSFSKLDVHLGPLCGCTPLHIAVMKDQCEIVSLLLSHPNINIHARCRDSGTALSQAITMYGPKSQALARQLLSHPKIFATTSVENIHFCLQSAARLGVLSTIARFIQETSKAQHGARLRLRPSVLIEAAQHGHVEVAKTVLQHPDIINATSLGLTALAAAAYAGHLNVVRLLLDQKVSVSASGAIEHNGLVETASLASTMCLSSQASFLALLQACLAGQEAMVEFLLSQPGVDVNAEDSQGWTPLAHAAVSGKANLCHMLLARPDIQPTAGGVSPLVRAAAAGQQETVQLFLSYPGLDPNETDEGWTALCAAAFFGFEAIVQFLLAQVNVDVNLGEPAPLLLAAFCGRTGIVRLLLGHNNIDVHIQDQRYCNVTPLWLACTGGHWDTAKALLKLLDTGTDYVPLRKHPSMKNAFRSLRKLVYPSDVWAGDQDTILHVAARSHVNLVRLFVDSPATDLIAQNAKGETPLAMILEKLALSQTMQSSIPEVTLFLTKCMDNFPITPSMLSAAAGMGVIDAVRRILELDTLDINHVDEKGYTALTLAVFKHHLDVVKILLADQCIDPNCGDPPPLLAACDLRRQTDRLALIELLLAHPDINANVQWMKHGFTTLGVACFINDQAMITLLLGNQEVNVNAGRHHPLALILCMGGYEITTISLLCQNCPDLDVNSIMNGLLYLGGTYSIPYSAEWGEIPSVYRILHGENTQQCTSGPRSAISPANGIDSDYCSQRRQHQPYGRGFINCHPVPHPQRFLRRPHLPDSEGDRVLVHCVKAGRIRAFEILLYHDRIDVNAQNVCGCTALIVGSHLRRHTFLDILLARPEVDPTIRCPTHGTTALLAAAHRLYFDTVDKIISSPLRNRLNFNESAGCGCNLFICASRSGDEDTFLSILGLVDWEDSPNITDCKFSRTAFLWASFYGHDDIVRLLLSIPKADLNSRDKDGNTALMLAVGGGHENVVEILLASPFLGAINARNNNGDTALSLAVWYGYDRIVRLISARVDIDIVC